MCLVPQLVYFWVGEELLWVEVPLHFLEIAMQQWQVGILQGTELLSHNVVV